ncbi:histidine kinase [Tenacibaculum sp. 190524A02b]|uniref:sensor histidine kinase n=1 Tax=Tenacibaculum vairaonense TaxID=3137860 RepID=UPI0031FBA14C
MNKFFKALAIGITTSIVFCVVFVAFFYFFMNEKEMVNKYFISRLISIIFFPVFFSVYFFRRENIDELKFLKYLIRVVVFSVLGDLFLTIIKTYGSGFFNFSPSLNQTFFTILVALASSLILYTSRRKQKEIIYKKDNLLYSWFLVTVFWCFFSILNSKLDFYLLVLASLGQVYVWLLHFMKKSKNSKHLKYIYYLFLVTSPLVYAFLLGEIDKEVYYSSSIIFEIALGGISYEMTLLREVIIPVVYFMLIKILSCFIYTFKETKINKEKESKELQENYKNLKERLSPDYLFQNLNYLSNIIEEAPVKSIQFSENLSEVYRYFLKNEKEDIVKLKEEVGFIESYVSIYKVKTNYRLVFEIEIKEKYMESYIVSGVVYAILKQLENAPKKEVNYRFSVIEEQLTVEIDSILELDNEMEFIKNKYSYFTEECVQFFNSNNKTLIKLPILSEY